MPKTMSQEDCCSILGVSRETSYKFKKYIDILSSWQRNLNLVGKSTLLDPWRRHVLDCGQVVKFIKSGKEPVLDLGSGAGLPGIIISIMGVKNVKLIESDKRKAVFLREVSRLFDLSTAVFDERIETLPPMKPRIIVSRALGTIDNILYLSKKQITVKTEVIQFVGENESKEIGKQKLNKFNIKSTSCKTYQSITREKSKIVVYSF